MFLGAELLIAVSASLTNYLTGVLPEDEVFDNLDKPFKNSYDFIIVGSGSAGSVLASRLSEINDVSVLLLEAGGSELETDKTQIPLVWGELLGTRFDYGYYTVPQKHSHYATKDQKSFWSLGNMLGGTSNLNVMTVARGSPYDYDKWEKEGATGWSFEDVLPYFIMMENMTIPELRESEWHGKEGPLTVSLGEASQLSWFNRKAAEELGMPVVDNNGDGLNQIGFAPLQSNIKEGVRCGSTSCYLRPVLHRKNLQVNIKSQVSKLIITDGVVQGVMVMKADDPSGKEIEIFAKREVILSAGTVGSPKILMLSGIGPKEHLESLQIPIYADLPVGRNLRDHVDLLLPMRLNASLGFTEKKLADTELLLQFIRNRQGIYSKSGGDGNIFVDVSEGKSDDNRPGGHIIFSALPYTEGFIKSPIFNYKEEVIKELSTRVPENSFLAFTFLLHPKSVGYIELKSTDPRDDPNIDLQYLSDERDVDDFVQIVRHLQRLQETQSWKSIGAEIIRQDQQNHCGDTKYDTDDYWRCIVRHFAITGHHVVGTCKMGSTDDPTSVVDPFLRVKGIHNLRVVDGSVLRSLPSGNTNLPIVMIAEKASDMIKEAMKWKSVIDSEDLQRKYYPGHHQP